MSANRSSVTEPLFLELNGHRLFALQILPVGPAKGLVLYLPPFAEEMNRCRSHVAATARALAQVGYRCLLLDPYGSGDSEGRISDIDWEGWLDDAAAAAGWLVGQAELPLTVWGLRTGALLAAELALRGTPAVSRLLFWQPVLDGNLFITQHLRLRIASQLVHETERETTDAIRRRLAAGEEVEVAGYPLPGRMAEALSKRRMAGLEGLARLPIDWIEIVSKPDQAMALPSRKLVDALVAGGGRVQAQTVACPPIWQLYEREDAPQLPATTLRMMEAST